MESRAGERGGLTRFALLAGGLADHVVVRAHRAQRALERARRVVVAARGTHRALLLAKTRLVLATRAAQNTTGWRGQGQMVFQKKEGANPGLDASQSTHCGVRACACSTDQSVHAVLPLAPVCTEKVPRTHSVHALCPALSLNEPDGPAARSAKRESHGEYRKEIRKEGPTRHDRMNARATKFTNKNESKTQSPAASATAT